MQLSSQKEAEIEQTRRREVNPKVKGVYVLLLRVTNGFSRRVASLGRIHFERGNYAYVGSAQSSLFPRLERQCERKKRLHWHIDYLTTCKNVFVKDSIYSAADSKEFECRVSAELSVLPFSKAVPSFGSSDCMNGCESHLFMLKSNESHVIRSTLHVVRKLHLKPMMYQYRNLHKNNY